MEVDNARQSWQELQLSSLGTSLCKLQPQADFGKRWNSQCFQMEWLKPFLYKSPTSEKCHNTLHTVYTQTNYQLKQMFFLMEQTEWKIPREKQVKDVIVANVAYFYNVIQNINQAHNFIQNLCTWMEVYLVHSRGTFNCKRKQVITRYSNFHSYLLFCSIGGLHVIVGFSCLALSSSIYLHVPVVVWICWSRCCVCFWYK